VHCILYEIDPVSNIAPFVYATDLSANGTYLKKNNSQCAGSQGRGIQMGRHNTFLLDDGDELQISEAVTLTFYSMKPVQHVQFTALQKREKAVFAQQYLITGRLLGEGGYGKVLIGIEQESQRQLACKIVRLDHLYDKLPVPNLRLPSAAPGGKSSSGRKRWPTRVAACFREFEILKDLSHPNIVAIEKVFWSHNTIYIFQELVTGGDLFSFLEYKGGRLDNQQAAVIIRQILIGIEYLHEQDIVHRDLKPDNILMTSLEDGARVVITDFGAARLLPSQDPASNQETSKRQRMFSYVGTLEFAAPEIHKANRAIPIEEGYSKSVDMWSIGSITATVLTGDVIFTDRTHPHYHENPRHVIIALAARCDLSVLDDEYHPTWSEVGEAPKNFIRRLLVLDENDRMTASAALAHRWFANECYAEDLEDVYMRSIEDWQPRQTSSQLVERISKRLPDLTAIRLTGHMISQETVSRYFHPSEQELTHNIFQTLSASQHWRANTPLPSIIDDNDRVQFASQIVPPSYETNDANNENQAHNDGNYDHHQKRHCGEIQATERSKYKYSEECYDEHLASHSVSQRASVDGFTNDTATQGMYRTDEVVGREDSYGSTESLNNVINVAYSQVPHIFQVQHRQVQEALPSVLVQETPPSQYEANPDYTPEDSYEQTQDPEEDRREYASEEEQASVLVRETPPDTDGDRDRSSNDGLPSYGQWIAADITPTAANKIYGESHGKRQWLSYQQR
jgi:serine/threonine protein kinase